MAKGAKKKKRHKVPPERLINEAASQGKLAQVRKLVEAGIDVNAREDFLGFRPLISAAANGHLKVVKYLLSAGAQVDAVVMDQFLNDYLGATALMIACRNGHREVVEEFLAAGADHSKNVTKNEPPTAITSAALMGNLGIVRLLLERGTMLPNFALHGPVRRRHVEVVQELIRAGADVHFTSVTGHGLVANACAGPGEGEKAEKQIAIARLLIDAGADIDAADLGGDTALMAAIRIKNEQVVRFLINAGANVNARDAAGVTPLHYAALTGQTELARLLLAAGADPVAVDCDGETPIDEAKNNKELLKILKEAAVRSKA